MLRAKEIGELLEEHIGEEIKVLTLSSLDGTVLAYGSQKADLEEVQHISSLSASLWGEYESAGRATLSTVGSLDTVIVDAEKGSLFLTAIGGEERERGGEGFLVVALAAKDAKLGLVQKVLERTTKELGAALEGLGTAPWDEKTGSGASGGGGGGGGGVVGTASMLSGRDGGASSMMRE